MGDVSILGREYRFCQFCNKWIRPFWEKQRQACPVCRGKNLVQMKIESVPTGILDETEESEEQIVSTEDRKQSQRGIEKEEREREVLIALSSGGTYAELVVKLGDKIYTDKGERQAEYIQWLVGDVMRRVKKGEVPGASDATEKNESGKKVYRVDLNIAMQAPQEETLLGGWDGGDRSDTDQVGTPLDDLRE